MDNTQYYIRDLPDIFANCHGRDDFLDCFLFAIFLVAVKLRLELKYLTLKNSQNNSSVIPEQQSTKFLSKTHT